MANIIISPSRYVQGKNEIENIHTHLENLGKNFLIISFDMILDLVEEKIKKSFKDTNCNLSFENFQGECCMSEIQRLCEKAKDKGCDCIVGIGGGKTLDTAKAVAHYQGLPVVIVPTIASTDAPCSALSVIYTQEGIFEKYLFLPQNPNLVLVDTDIVAKAPVRLLVSGMGDALATYFEARACQKSNSLSCAGGNATMAAMELAHLCYKTLMSDGLKAKLAADCHVCTKAVENIIETNTYLSGIGFESAGLAAAHAIHNGFTVLHDCHDLFHGEKVAFGTIVQLVLENAPMEEIEEVIYFCMSVGLPTTLADIKLENVTEEQIWEVAKASAAENETIHNMPFSVEPINVYDAIWGADALGRFYKGI